MKGLLAWLFRSCPAVHLQEKIFLFMLYTKLNSPQIFNGLELFVKEKTGQRVVQCTYYCFFALGFRYVNGNRYINHFVMTNVSTILSKV